ncbi:hypothetical protein EVAR_21737_1 [Eumeta japonica]|uniref:Uncharacterized protein n=1 Tax=Eumeta variegata TaxID=151549 RepID=A0A4C1W689_EUMVA|nr:hypothetical protein EVAR_21737_1 [Eumeta japonica]
MAGISGISETFSETRAGAGDALFYFWEFLEFKLKAKIDASMQTLESHVGLKASAERLHPWTSTVDPQQRTQVATGPRAARPCTPRTQSVIRVTEIANALCVRDV